MAGGVSREPSAGSSEKVGGGLAGQQRDGVFVLSAENAEICVLRLSGLELRLGLRDGFIVTDTGLAQIARQLQRLLIGAHRRIEYLLESILAAQLVVVGGEIGLRGEADVFEIGGAGLGGECVRFHGVLEHGPTDPVPRMLRAAASKWGS